MGQFDNSMYRNVPAVDFGQIADGFERGMKLGDMMKDARKQSMIADANKSSMVVGPDGKKSLDYGVLETKLGEYGLPEEALKAKNQFMQNQTQKMDFDKKRQLYEAEEYAREAFNVTDQASQDAAVARLQAKGLDTSRIPKIYSNDFIAQARREGMSTLERLNFEQKEKDLALRRQDQSLDRSYKLNEMGLRRQERQDAREVRQEEKEQKLMTPYGLARTDMDAKDLKSADEGKKSFDSKLNELISLRKNYGGEVFNRDAVGRGKQLSKDLLLTYKNMAKLGVLSQSDTDIINAIIPDDPLEFRSPLAAAQGQDPILSNMEKFKQDSDADFKNKLQNRLRGAPTVQQTSTQPPQDQNPNKPAWAK